MIELKLKVKLRLEAQGLDYQENRATINGVELCWFETPRRSEDTVLLVHATGFHSRCWDAVAAQITDRHIIALDMRGHGRSENTGPFD